MTPWLLLAYFGIVAIGLLFLAVAAGLVYAEFFLLHLTLVAKTEPDDILEALRPYKDIPEVRAAIERLVSQLPKL